MKMLPVLLSITALFLLASCGAKSPETSSSPAPAEAAPDPELVRVPPELEHPGPGAIIQASIDIVDEVIAFKRTPDENSFSARADSPLWLRGWAYDDAHKTVPATVYVELDKQGGGQRFFIKTERQERADVATGFKIPWARNSGFTSTVLRDHRLPKGKYDLKVYQVADGVAQLTTYYATHAVTLDLE
jgi:hypothetical protein